MVRPSRSLALDGGWVAVGDDNYAGLIGVNRTTGDLMEASVLEAPDQTGSGDWGGLVALDGDYLVVIDRLVSVAVLFRVVDDNVLTMIGDLSPVHNDFIDTVAMAFPLVVVGFAGYRETFGVGRASVLSWNETLGAFELERLLQGDVPRDGDFFSLFLFSPS